MGLCAVIWRFPLRDGAFPMLFRPAQVIVSQCNICAHITIVHYIYISVDCRSNSYFLRLTDEPGKQVRSAIKIKNTSKSHVAFKVWC